MTTPHYAVYSRLGGVEEKGHPFVKVRQRNWQPLGCDAKESCGMRDCLSLVPVVHMVLLRLRLRFQNCRHDTAWCDQQAAQQMMLQRASGR
jgi:hypothetical protein